MRSRYNGGRVPLRPTEPHYSFLGSFSDSSSVLVALIVKGLASPFKIVCWNDSEGLHQMAEKK